VQIYIKYMVGQHCKMAVKEVLKELGLHFIISDKGIVDIMENITTKQREALSVALLKSGLELMDEKKVVLFGKIKTIIAEMVYHFDEFSTINFPHYLSEKLNCDYTYMANLFSEIQGITIEQFIIFNKIERIKEMIVYEGLSPAEIAIKMHYNNVVHLSHQFKKNSGSTLSHFMELKGIRRKAIEEVVY
jgi:YesN/AraC family two-component response regulator